MPAQTISLGPIQNAALRRTLTVTGSLKPALQIYSSQSLNLSYRLTQSLTKAWSYVNIYFTLISFLTNNKRDYTVKCARDEDVTGLSHISDRLLADDSA